MEFCIFLSPTLRFSVKERKGSFRELQRQLGNSFSLNRENKCIMY